MVWDFTHFVGEWLLFVFEFWMIVFFNGIF